MHAESQESRRAKDGSDTLERILDRAAVEVRAGRPWRAREILRGALRTHHESARLLEAYGRVLYDLGDRLEAGKYLFLSGAEGPEADEAVELFLDRHGGGEGQDLLAQFPRRIRQVPLGELPSRVRDYVASRGVHPPRDPAQTTLEQAFNPAAGWKGTLWSLGCAAVSGFLIVSCLIGIVTMVGWIAER